MVPQKSQVDFINLIKKYKVFRFIENKLMDAKGKEGGGWEFKKEIVLKEFLNSSQLYKYPTYQELINILLCVCVSQYLSSVFRVFNAKQKESTVMITYMLL